jgi:hypothetical protein
LGRGAASSVDLRFGSMEMREACQRRRLDVRSRCRRLRATRSGPVGDSNLTGGRAPDGGASEEPLSSLQDPTMGADCPTAGT